MPVVGLGHKFPDNAWHDAPAVSAAQGDVCMRAMNIVCQDSGVLLLALQEWIFWLNSLVALALLEFLGITDNPQYIRVHMRNPDKDPGFLNIVPTLQRMVFGTKGFEL